MVNHDRLEKINQQLKIMLWRVVTVRRSNLIAVLLQLTIPLLTSILLVFRLSSPSNATSFNFTTVPAQTFPNPMLTFGEVPKFYSVLYAPTNNLSTSIMNSLKKTLQRKGYQPDIHSFPNEEALYEEYLNRTQGTSGIPLAGVIFEGNGDDEEGFTYTIRSEMPASIKAPFPVQNYNGPSLFSSYQSFTQLQSLLNLAYLEKILPKSKLNMEELMKIGDSSVKWYRFPFPSYTPQDRRPVAELAPTALIFGFIIIYAIVIKRLATEKSNQIREMYRITGLIDWIYWFTHLVDNYSIFLVQAVIITILYTIGIDGNGQDCVFKYTSSFMIFFILALWGFNFILSAFAFSIPFNRPIFALTVAIVFWVIQIAPGYFVDPLVNQSVDPLDTEMPRLISCLLPNMALTLAFHVISQKEMYGSGATLTSLFESTPLYGNLSLGIILICLIVTSLFHIPLIYYLVNVVPTQYGIPKPWLFPIYSLFRYKPKKEPDYDENDEPGQTVHDYLEPLEPSDEVKISIRNISKDFGSSSRQAIAVDNVSLDVPHKQITMLLGENGAGKTTLMSMIIGLIPPTRGTVEVNGHDILEETIEARKSLSFCPQTNILQSDLTVEQHLILYGSIKGVPDSQLKLEVEKILEDIRLEVSKSKKPSELSGGMCRRLNLGIALIGDTEVIVLDEPTSGLDPESRRAVWDILNEIKGERTVLMTTHFIEEADAVGDRIAIMRKGKLACFGSPMFLKKIFGTGYELRIAKNEESNLENIVNVTESYFPDATLGYAVGGEVIFALPQELSDNSIFFKFFQELEAKKSDLKISSWGLSYTTLEDVFIRVIQSTEQKRDSRSESAMKVSNGEAKSTCAIEADQIGSKQVLHRKVEVTSGVRLTYRRLEALLIKRVHYAKRYWKILLFQILVPVVMFSLIMLLDLKIVKMTSSTDIKIDLKLEEIYGSTKGFFSNLSGGNASQFGRNFEFVMAKDKVEIEFLNSTTTIDDHMLDKAATLSFYDYTHDYMVSIEWIEKEVKVYFNGEATHGLPLAVDAFFETLYQNLTGSSVASSKFNVKNHPFPAKNDLLKPMIFISTRPRMWTIFLEMTMPFLAASYVLIPTHENSSKAKLLQLMTGLHPILYWLGHFIFDMVIHIICTGFIYGAVFTLNSQNIFNQDNMQLAFISSLLASGVACIPMAYIFSFVFDRPSIGFSFLVMLYMVFGVSMSITDFILESYVPDQLSQSSKDIFDRVVGFFPLHTMTTEIVRTLTISLSSSVCGLIDEKVLQAQCSKEGLNNDLIRRCCPNLCSKTDDCFSYRDPLSWKYGILRGMIQLLCEACLFFIILLLLEFCSDRLELLTDFKRRVLNILPYCKTNRQEDKMKSNDQEVEDSDVSAEEKRVRRNIISNPAKLSSMSFRKNYAGNTTHVSPSHQDILSVMELKKKYGNDWAVQGLSFGVHQNECFGLLGVNGAGKSTTFKMLVGDIRPTHGNAYIDRFSLVNTKRKFQECIGYCPQYDALIDRLTAREMLYLFGRLRGMEEMVIYEFANRLIRDVDLRRHADKITSFYSGGNKRKLSLALALIGNPRVIFLDEPSSGVDAGNRRRMWSILSALRENGCSLVLTSHSMEECETLCSRIAIMVNGKFRCLGSLQHLRHKFGQGYSLYIKIKSNKVNDPNYLKKLKGSVEKNLGAELKQHHLVNLFYHIKEKSLKWSTLFEIMEDIKSNHQLEDYVISDTSLEQIFMDFARKQLSSD